MRTVAMVCTLMALAGCAPNDTTPTTSSPAPPPVWTLVDGFEEAHTTPGTTTLPPKEPGTESIGVTDSVAVVVVDGKDGP